MLKSLFYNEIFFQRQAKKILELIDYLIIPEILTNEIYVSDFNDRESNDLILGMEFIEMVPIRTILTPDNCEEIYNKITKVLTILEANGVYHNDLNDDNIQAKIIDGNIYIVLIDFGEARFSEPTRAFKVIGSVYFNDLFKNKDAGAGYLPYSSDTFLMMLHWTRGVRGGSNKRTKLIKSTKRIKRIKSIKLIKRTKSTKRTKRIKRTKKR
jgi:serine/threonine protein kinase